jgi:hypothetical protein
MKNIIKTMFIAVITAGSLSGCVGDDDTTLPYHIPVKVSEDFIAGETATPVAIEGWMNYAEAGTFLWKKIYRSGKDYAEFNPYGSGQASNIGWLITPKFTLEEGHSFILKFTSAQAYVSSGANKLEALISTDFDGTNVTGATWTVLPAAIPPTNATYFAMMNSGNIDLSAYTGDVHIAFKYTGSGTNTNIDGLYQLDNIAVVQKQ